MLDSFLLKRLSFLFSFLSLFFHTVQDLIQMVLAFFNEMLCFLFQFFLFAVFLLGERLGSLWSVLIWLGLASGRRLDAAAGLVCFFVVFFRVHCVGGCSRCSQSSHFDSFLCFKNFAGSLSSVFNCFVDNVYVIF